MWDGQREERRGTTGAAARAVQGDGSTTHCEHNIPETKKGAGPCDIRSEVMKRNGKPNWWCRTHGLAASGPDGSAVKRCSGAWFDPVSDDMQIDVDAATGEFAAWGVVPPAISIGKVPSEPGTVHGHLRREAGGEKIIDSSYDIVRVHAGEATETIEGMAAQAFALSVLTGNDVRPLVCPHCGEVHIDELMFATHPHVKHLCNSCGRNFWDRSPSISNPLGGAQDRLGLPDLQPANQVDRRLEIRSADYGGIAIWPTNRAIVSTMSRAEDKGLHVHAWSHTGQELLNETYSPVILDGEVLDEDQVRMLTVQRVLAEGAPIVALACVECGHSILSPTEGWIEPRTRHTCDACGTENRTRRKSFLNPLVEKLP